MTATLIGAADPNVCHICYRPRSNAVRLTADGELEPTGVLHCPHCDLLCAGCDICQAITDAGDALIDEANERFGTKGQPK